MIVTRPAAGWVVDSSECEIHVGYHDSHPLRQFFLSVVTLQIDDDGIFTTIEDLNMFIKWISPYGLRAACDAIRIASIALSFEMFTMQQQALLMIDTSKLSSIECFDLGEVHGNQLFTNIAASKFSKIPPNEIPARVFHKCVPLWLRELRTQTHVVSSVKAVVSTFLASHLALDGCREMDYANIECSGIDHASTDEDDYTEQAFECVQQLHAILQ